MNRASIGDILDSISTIKKLFLVVAPLAVVWGIVRLLVAADVDELQERAVLTFVYLPIALLICFFVVVGGKAIQINLALHRIVAEGAKIHDAATIARLHRLVRCTKLLQVILCAVRGTDIGKLLVSVNGSAR